jgi:hypothetical protein
MGLLGFCGGGCSRADVQGSSILVGVAACSGLRRLALLTTVSAGVELRRETALAATTT